ncbi:molybdopterin dehydrogenase FAD-binding [Arthrobacter sp. Hiyo4]|nr:molybdopterin dehydrogenase FAD-binding [Arthrobacter sp. Hiyo4]
MQLRFTAAKMAGPAALAAAVGKAIPAELYHDDIHGLPEWRRDMTLRLAEEIRAELLEERLTVSGDFWAGRPHALSPQPSAQPETTAQPDTAKNKQQKEA